MRFFWGGFLIGLSVSFLCRKLSHQNFIVILPGSFRRNSRLLSCYVFGTGAFSQAIFVALPPTRVCSATWGRRREQNSRFGAGGLLLLVVHVGRYDDSLRDLLSKQRSWAHKGRLCFTFHLESILPLTCSITKSLFLHRKIHGSSFLSRPRSASLWCVKP